MQTCHFRSCFIVNVDFYPSKKEVILTDSMQNQYYIDVTCEEVYSQFKQWFKNVFTKGVSQTLTVLQYSMQDISECEVKLTVDKILMKNEDIVT